MTTIYVIRHAEAEGNIYRRAHGQYNSLITYNGKRQIQALKERFRDIHIDAVYASDLNRTCETAAAVYEPKGLPLIKDARFREVKMGVWEDMPFGYLDHFEHEQMTSFNTAPNLWKVDGCELFADYTSRFISALTDVAEKHDGQTIAVFTHGAISNGAFRLMFGDAAAKAGHCDNTGVSELHYSNGIFGFKYLYDNSHLNKEISTLAHQCWWRGKADFNLWFRPNNADDHSLYEKDLRPQRKHKTFIAMLADKPVGYISFDAGSNLPTIQALYLLPEWRHIHMGDQLLGVAVTFLRLLKKNALTIRIPVDNSETIAFFRHHGAQMVQEDAAAVVFRIDFAVPPLG